MKQDRNGPCACGSGKKAKRCCLNANASRSVTIQMPVIQRAEAMEGILRACDGCQACCRGALTINDPELVVPRETDCPNLSTSGCAIHGESMPKTCSGFICSYLVEPGNLTPADRPDQVGAIVRLTRNAAFPPPLDRSVHLNECKSGGMFDILQNPSWRKIIRNDLLAGIPLLCSFWDDSLAREVIHFRFVDGQLKCELTSCRGDGTPVLNTKEPVHGEPIMCALVIPQGFAFDADVLIAQLGLAAHLTIGSAGESSLVHDLHFWFTARQARLAKCLMQLAKDEPGSPSIRDPKPGLMNPVPL